MGYKKKERLQDFCLSNLKYKVVIYWSGKGGGIIDWEREVKMIRIF